MKYNAKEGLREYDFELDKIYCGPGKEYEIGREFGKLQPELKSKFENESSFRIGQFVKANVLVREADPETKATKSRLIGKAEIIDIILDKPNDWRLRLQYFVCNNYKSNLWPHYSDVEIEKCEKI
ncbi:MAG: hypothetical protein JXB49_00310 [Bacteroidales bacterium]|nr:hypothetical protein [Bacteroidales bacterium]